MRKNFPVYIAFTIAFLAIVSLILAFWLRSTTVVLIIRHAERNDTAVCSPPSIYGSPNPPLITVDGVNPRAQALVHVCEDDGITAIYASEFCRTRLTVEPLANRLGLPVNIVNQFTANGSVDVSGLISKIRSDHRGETVLVAGHTSTVPAIIRELSGITVAEIPESEFDNLFAVILPRWFGQPKVVRLNYGAPG
jgi:broad specificity phosphatase PhoE